MAKYGILRATKIKSRGDLAGLAAHNRRSLLTLNADRSIQNLDLRPDVDRDILARWDQIDSANGGTKHRKDAVLAIELLMTFSSDATADIDARKWGRKCLEFGEEIFGRENVLLAELHLDEKTPHVHLLVAPFAQGRLNAAHWLDGPTKCRRLQNDFFARVANFFGLSRGISGSQRKHVPQKQLYVESNAQQRTASEAIKTLEAPLRLTLPALPAPSIGVITAGGRDEYRRNIELAVEAALAGQIDEQGQRFRSCLTPILETAKQTNLLQHARADLESAVVSMTKKHARIIDRLRTRAAHLREIPLPVVAELFFGFPGRRQGASLVWDGDANKLVVTGSQFKDFKMPQESLGGGAIDLTLHLYGCSYQEAIRLLALEFPSQLFGSLRQYHGNVARKELAESLAHPKKPDFLYLLERYAKAESDKLQQARRYLVESRNIRPAIVDELIRRGDLWANAWGSCVFAHRDAAGELRGCSIRATAGDFKQCLGDKTTAWFSVGTGLQSSGRLILTESPIDTMSYQELHPLAQDETVISTGGQALAEPVVALGRPLLLAQDNDPAGEAQAAAFVAAARGAHLCAERLLPTGKDWNETLTTKINDLRRISQETSDRERRVTLTDRETERREREAAPAARQAETRLSPHWQVSYSRGFGGSDRGRNL